MSTFRGTPTTSGASTPSSSVTMPPPQRLMSPDVTNNTPPSSSQSSTTASIPPPGQFRPLTGPAQSLLPPVPPGVLKKPQLIMPMSRQVNVVCKMPNCNPNTGPPVSGPLHCPAPMSPISEHSVSQNTSNNESQPNGPPGSPPGFNSSCQQCLEERAAAEAGVGVLNHGHSLGSIERLEAVKSAASSHNNGVDFPQLPTEDTLEAFQALEETRGRRNSEPAGPGRTYECETWCRETSRLIAGCLGVCCLAIGYATIGGFLFMAIESRAANNIEVSASAVAMNVSAAHVKPLESKLELPGAALEVVAKARAETVAKLWDMTSKLNILYPANWTRLAAKEVLWFQDQMTETLIREMMSARNQATHTEQLQAAVDTKISMVAAKEWTFARGLLYSVSLLTTVGKTSLLQQHFFLP